jgi:hypothetical protein
MGYCGFPEKIIRRRSSVLASASRFLQASPSLPTVELPWGMQSAGVLLQTEERTMFRCPVFGCSAMIGAKDKIAGR